MTSGADVFMAAFESLTPDEQRVVYAVMSADIAAQERAQDTSTTPTTEPAAPAVDDD